MNGTSTKDGEITVMVRVRPLMKLLGREGIFQMLSDMVSARSQTAPCLHPGRQPPPPLQ